MPIGTSTGKTYDDQFEQVADMHGLLPTDPNATPKEGQTVPRPVISTSQAAKDIVSGAQEMLLPSLTPMSEEESTRRLRAFQDAKPGDKVPELEKPGAMSVAEGATDAVGLLPVGGASSKAMFLGLGGMRRLLGDFAFENTLKRADALIARTGDPILNRQASTELSLKTGVTIGADNLPRYEIPNHRSVLLEENMQKGPPTNNQINPLNKNYTLTPKPGSTVGDIIHHPELYKAYPELEKIPVNPLSERYKNRPGVEGAFTEHGIELAPMEPDKLRDVLLHELQHGIQRKEGFARGGDRMDYAPDLATRFSLTDDAYNKWMADAADKYLSLAGETEARNVVTRRDLTISQRARMLPEDTEDIAREKQIIKK